MGEHRDIPPVAWRRRLDAVLTSPGRPSRPPLMEIVKLLPLMLRLQQHLRHERSLGREPENPFTPPVPGAIQGVPLGGIGGGSITRGWRGDLCRWQLRPGHPQHGTVWADQFSVRAERPGQAPQAQVLYPGRPPGNRLSSWRWNLPGDRATYHALFPRAWTVYEEALPGLRLTCRQISPVIPHNYRESSLPVAIFAWNIENLGPDPARVSLLFTFQNGNGADNDSAGGHANRELRLEGSSGTIVGATLHHLHRQRRSDLQPEGLSDCPRLEPQPDYPLTIPCNEGQNACYDPLTFAIGAASAPGVEVSSCPQFFTNGDGSEVWLDWTTHGALTSRGATSPSSRGETIGAAVAAAVEVPPRASRSVAFALAWDMPLARYGDGRAHRRRYTRFFGASGNAAPALLAEALEHYPSWEAQIEAWQRPILEDADLPDDYKAALLNELYYVVDGGAVWTDGEENAAPAPAADMGHFAYLEGLEYPMYNTYDVHFYASFALAQLWPKLELSLQRDIARSVAMEHPEERRLVASGRLAPRKVRGAVPHDLGLPTEDPWYKVDGYNFQDVSRWKDLGPKFVLQVYRDWAATADLPFVQQVWPAVREALAYVGRFDHDGDGIPENEGYPDQTYDMWPAAGVSAYSGGLWLAALEAAAALADILGEAEAAEEYRAIGSRGRSSYEAKLWNGQYYDYDSSASRHHDSIMADQLAGQWYARSCGLPDIVPRDHALSALKEILEHNVRGFGDGTLGAVNGMRPAGGIDTSNMQSQEAWTGTTYGLAATMICHGLIPEAFETARSVYGSVYGRLGYWFQTPEAWDRRGSYRSLAYMRPLAIWAIQWAWERRNKS